MQLESGAAVFGHSGGLSAVVVVFLFGPAFVTALVGYVAARRWAENRGPGTGPLLCGTAILLNLAGMVQPGNGSEIFHLSSLSTGVAIAWVFVEWLTIWQKP